MKNSRVFKTVIAVLLIAVIVLTVFLCKEVKSRRGLENSLAGINYLNCISVMDEFRKMNDWALEPDDITDYLLLQLNDAKHEDPVSPVKAAWDFYDYYYAFCLEVQQMDPEGFYAEDAFAYFELVTQELYDISCMPIDYVESAEDKAAAKRDLMDPDSEIYKEITDRADKFNREHNDEMERWRNNLSYYTKRGIT